MEKFGSIALALALCISLLSGCSSSQEESIDSVATSTARSEQTQQPDDNKKSNQEIATSDENESQLLEDDGGTELEPEIPEDTGPNVLVAYFSQYAFLKDNARAVDGVSSASIVPGDVERIAGMIQDNTEADLFQIIAADPYPADYDDTAERARQEMNENARPSLTQSVESMDRYDVVYLGYPVWGGSFPLPVATFLESYDFSGKTIVPFCTHEGFVSEDIWEQFEIMAPEAELLEGYAINLLNSRPSAESIMDWLNSLGLLETAD